MINFPDTPTLAQIFTTAGSSWQWDGNKWEGATVAGGGPYLLLTGGTLTGALNINAAGAGPSLTVKTKGVVIGNAAPDPGQGGLALNANAAAPPAALAGQGAAAIYAPDGTASALAVVGNTAPALRTVGFGGTLAAPLASPISSVIGQVATLGYNGAATALGAAINAVTDEAWTATANGAHLDFYCVPSGTAAPHITLGLHSNGQMIYDAAGNPPTGFQQGGGTINVAGGYYVNGGGAAGVALVASGNSYINSGNVGIGTTAPAARLHVASGSGYFTPAVTPTTNATARQLLIGEGSGNSAYVMALGYANVGGFVGTMQATSNGSPTGLSLNADGGNVGIGTTTPQNKLDVNGGITVRMQGTPAISIDHITGSYRFIRWLTSGSARWDVLTNATAEGSGNVGSDFNITRYDNTGTSLGVALSITRSNGACANTSGAWTTISDASVKQNVQPYTRGLDAIVALKPVQFRYVAGTPFAEADKPSRALFGLIADDVKPHVPEIVGTTTATIGKKEGVELSTLEPGNLIYAIINAIKELNAKVVAMSPPPARRKAA